MLGSKKARLKKEAPLAPSESEIDMGVFTAKHGNLLEQIFEGSGSRGAKPGKAARRIDISKITPPTSPPSRTFNLSPDQDDLGDKENPDDVEVECVSEGGGAGGAGDRGKGVETGVESSETTLHQTIYTRRTPGAGGGVSSKLPQSHEFENVQAGSWDTHNPACDDLSHAPLPLFVSPPAERLFQKKRNRFDLLDDHIHVEVNFFATSQEIVREWKLMGEEILEFENEKKAFAEEREKFNAERKGLLWRVSDVEQKLAQEKQANSHVTTRVFKVSTRLNTHSQSVVFIYISCEI
ncbi:hypothetical protein Hanom_Chr02g00099211 [Helianthus anomalus]